MSNLDIAIEKGHERYFRNAYWKGLYEDAPRDAQAYLDLIFSQQDGGNDPENDTEFKSRLTLAYSGMSDDGWEYLIRNATSQMEKHHLQKKKEQYRQANDKPPQG